MEGVLVRMDIFADTKEEDRKQMERTHYKVSYDPEAYKFFKSNGNKGEWREEYEHLRGLQYKLHNKTLTIYSFYYYTKNKTDYYGVNKIAKFPIFNKYIVDLYDLFTNEIKRGEVYYEVKTLRKKYLLNEKQFKENLLILIKETKVEAKPNVADVEEYFLTSNILDDLLEVKEKWTTQYCYYDNKHISFENGYKLITKKFDNDEGVCYRRVEDIFLQWSGDPKIHNITYTNNEIKEIIKTYNQTPLDDKEGEVYKILLSSAVTNWFSKFLKDNNLTEIKQNALIGIRGNRKSFIGFNTFGLFGLTKSSDKSLFNRLYNVNASLKTIYPISLPRYYDEIPGFSDEAKQRMKDKANGDREFFTVNRLNGIDYFFDGSIECLTANSIEVEGDDYDDKQFTYEPRLSREISTEKSIEITNKVISTFANRVTDSSIKLGRYIYDELLKIDPNTILNEIKIDITREKKQFNVIQFGSKILDKLGLLTKYNLNEELFLNAKLSNNSNVESDLDNFRNCLNHLISNFERSSNYEFPYLIKMWKKLSENHYDDSVESRIYKRAYISLNSIGLYFKYDNNKISLVFDKRVLPNLKAISKNVYKRDFKYNTLKNLSEILPNSITKPSNCLIVDRLDEKSFRVQSKRLGGYAVDIQEILEIEDIITKEVVINV